MYIASNNTIKIFKMFNKANFRGNMIISGYLWPFALNSAIYLRMIKYYMQKNFKL